jgi:hypothetical protein
MGKSLLRATFAFDKCQNGLILEYTIKHGYDSS